MWSYPAIWRSRDCSDTSIVLSKPREKKLWSGREGNGETGMLFMKASHIIIHNKSGPMQKAVLYSAINLDRVLEVVPFA